MEKQILTFNVNVELILNGEVDLSLFKLKMLENLYDNACAATIGALMDTGLGQDDRLVRHHTTVADPTGEAELENQS